MFKSFCHISFLMHKYSIYSNTCNPRQNIIFSINLSYQTLSIRFLGQKWTKMSIYIEEFFLFRDIFGRKVISFLFNYYQISKCLFSTFIRELIIFFSIFLPWYNLRLSCPNSFSLRLIFFFFHKTSLDVIIFLIDKNNFHLFF